MIDDVNVKLKLTVTLNEQGLDSVTIETARERQDPVDFAARLNPIIKKFEADFLAELDSQSCWGVAG